MRKGKTRRQKRHDSVASAAAAAAVAVVVLFRLSASGRRASNAGNGEKGREGRRKGARRADGRGEESHFVTSSLHLSRFYDDGWVCGWVGNRQMRISIDSIEFRKRGRPPSSQLTAILEFRPLSRIFHTAAKRFNLRDPICSHHRREEEKPDGA